MEGLQKQPRIINKKWTDAAQGQPCTLQIPGVCNYNPETTVPCHLPGEGKGVGYKTDDFTVDGCSNCHRAIDGDWMWETKGQFRPDEKYWFMLRALQRTLRNRYQRGIKFNV